MAESSPRSGQVARSSVIASHRVSELGRYFENSSLFPYPEDSFNKTMHPLAKSYICSSNLHALTFVCTPTSLLVIPTAHIPTGFDGEIDEETDSLTLSKVKGAICITDFDDLFHCALSCDESYFAAVTSNCVWIIPTKSSYTSDFFTTAVSYPAPSQNTMNPIRDFTWVSPSTFTIQFNEVLEVIDLEHYDDKAHFKLLSANPGSFTVGSIIPSSSLESLSSLESYSHAYVSQTGSMTLSTLSLARNVTDHETYGMLGTISSLPDVPPFPASSDIDVDSEDPRNLHYIKAITPTILLVGTVARAQSIDRYFPILYAVDMIKGSRMNFGDICQDGSSDVSMATTLNEDMEMLYEGDSSAFRPHQYFASYVPGLEFIVVSSTGSDKPYFIGPTFNNADLPLEIEDDLSSFSQPSVQPLSQRAKLFSDISNWMIIEMNENDCASLSGYNELSYAYPLGMTVVTCVSGSPSLPPSNHASGFMILFMTIESLLFVMEYVVHDVLKSIPGLDIGIRKLLIFQEGKEDSLSEHTKKTDLEELKDVKRPISSAPQLSSSTVQTVIEPLNLKVVDDVKVVDDTSATLKSTETKVTPIPTSTFEAFGTNTTPTFAFGESSNVPFGFQNLQENVESQDDFDDEDEDEDQYEDGYEDEDEDNEILEFEDEDKDEIADQYVKENESKDKIVDEIQSVDMKKSKAPSNIPFVMSSSLPSEDAEIPLTTEKKKQKEKDDEKNLDSSLKQTKEKGKNRKTPSAEIQLALEEMEYVSTDFSDSDNTEFHSAEEDDGESHSFLLSLLGRPPSDACLLSEVSHDNSLGLNSFTPHELESSILAGASIPNLANTEETKLSFDSVASKLTSLSVFESPDSILSREEERKKLVAGLVVKHKRALMQARKTNPMAASTPIPPLSISSKFSSPLLAEEQKNCVLTREQGSKSKIVQHDKAYLEDKVLSLLLDVRTSLEETASLAETSRIRLKAFVDPPKNIKPCSSVSALAERPAKDFILADLQNIGIFADVITEDAMDLTGEVSLDLERNYEKIRLTTECINSALKPIEPVLNSSDKPTKQDIKTMAEKLETIRMVEPEGENDTDKENVDKKALEIDPSIPSESILNRQTKPLREMTEKEYVSQLLVTEDTKALADAQTVMRNALEKKKHKLELMTNMLQDILSQKVITACFGSSNVDNTQENLQVAEISNQTYSISSPIQPKIDEMSFVDQSVSDSEKARDQYAALNLTKTQPENLLNIRSSFDSSERVYANVNQFLGRLADQIVRLESAVGISLVSSAPSGIVSTTRHRSYFSEKNEDDAEADTSDNELYLSARYNRQRQLKTQLAPKREYYTVSNSELRLFSSRPMITTHSKTIVYVPQPVVVPVKVEVKTSGSEVGDKPLSTSTSLKPKKGIKSLKSKQKVGKATAKTTSQSDEVKKPVDMKKEQEKGVEIDEMKKEIEKEKKKEKEKEKIQHVVHTVDTIQKMKQDEIIIPFPVLSSASAVVKTESPSLLSPEKTTSKVPSETELIPSTTSTTVFKPMTALKTKEIDDKDEYIGVDASALSKDNDSNNTGSLFGVSLGQAFGVSSISNLDSESFQKEKEPEKLQAKTQEPTKTSLVTPVTVPAVTKTQTDETKKGFGVFGDNSGSIFGLSSGFGTKLAQEGGAQATKTPDGFSSNFGSGFSASFGQGFGFSGTTANFNFASSEKEKKLEKAQELQPQLQERSKTPLVTPIVTSPTSPIVVPIEVTEKLVEKVLEKPVIEQPVVKPTVEKPEKPTDSGFGSGFGLGFGSGFGTGFGTGLGSGFGSTSTEKSLGTTLSSAITSPFTSPTTAEVKKDEKTTGFGGFASFLATASSPSASPDVSKKTEDSFFTTSTSTSSSASSSALSSTSTSLGDTGGFDGFSISSTPATASSGSLFSAMNSFTTSKPTSAAASSGFSGSSSFASSSSGTNSSTGSLFGNVSTSGFGSSSSSSSSSVSNTSAPESIFAAASTSGFGATTSSMGGFGTTPSTGFGSSGFGSNFGSNTATGSSFGNAFAAPPASGVAASYGISFGTTEKKKLSGGMSATAAMYGGSSFGGGFGSSTNSFAQQNQQQQQQQYQQQPQQSQQSQQSQQHASFGNMSGLGGMGPLTGLIQSSPGQASGFASYASSNQGGFAAHAQGNSNGFSALAGSGGSTGFSALAGAGDSTGFSALAGAGSSNGFSALAGSGGSTGFSALAGSGGGNSLFNQPQQGGSLFGQPQQQQGGSMFGQSQQQGGSMFGQPQQQGSFGQPQQQGSFGQSQQQGSFGQPQQQQSSFGQPQQQSSFGQPQQQSMFGQQFGQNFGNRY